MRQVTKEIEVLPTHYQGPGEGFVQDNAFVIKATEPVLVDTGIGIDTEEFMNVLELVIDPQDLKWIWLTHDDPDHTGSIKKVMDVATNARLVTIQVPSASTTINRRLSFPSIPLVPFYLPLVRRMPMKSKKQIWLVA